MTSLMRHQIVVYNFNFSEKDIFSSIIWPSFLLLLYCYYYNVSISIFIYIDIYIYIYITSVRHYEKSIIKRAIEYVKERTENFDNYYPCRRRN